MRKEVLEKTDEENEAPEIVGKIALHSNKDPKDVPSFDLQGGDVVAGGPLEGHRDQRESKLEA